MHSFAAGASVNWTAPPSAGAQQGRPLPAEAHVNGWLAEVAAGGGAKNCTGWHEATQVGSAQLSTSSDSSRNASVDAPATFAAHKQIGSMTPRAKRHRRRRVCRETSGEIADVAIAAAACSVSFHISCRQIVKVYLHTDKTPITAQGVNGRRLGAAKRAAPGKDASKAAPGLCKAAAMRRFRCLLDLQPAMPLGEGYTSGTAGGTAGRAAVGVPPSGSNRGDPSNDDVAGVTAVAGGGSVGSSGAAEADTFGGAPHGQAAASIAPRGGASGEPLAEMAYGELKAAAGGGAYAAAWRTMRRKSGGPFEHWIAKPPQLEQFGAGSA